MARRKKGIERDEFAGNYTVALREELLTIIGAYRSRKLSKDKLRVYAAMLERRALYAKSKVDLHGIVNAKRSVAHTISRARIASIECELRNLLRDLPTDGKKVAVSRKMVQYIARGQATCSEGLVLLFYCVRRLKQRRRLERLREGERYARFRYRMLADLAGCDRTTVGRAVEKLRRRGYIQTLEVQQRNRDYYGCLFVDGPLVSLTSQVGRGTRSAPKLPAPAADSADAPSPFLPTPENTDPKTRIPNERNFAFRLREHDGVLEAKIVSPRRRACAEFARIQERAAQMRASFADAVA